MGNVVGLVGPSGSGKSALSKALELFYKMKSGENVMDKYEQIIQDAVKSVLDTDVSPSVLPLVVEEAISHTTRPMRKGEIDGVHYHFVSEKEFLSLERYEDTVYCGNFYGLTVKAVQDVLQEAEVAIVVVDQHGIENIRAIQEITSIFLKTDLATMEAHMRARGDSDELISKRLKNAACNNELVYPAADYTIDNRGSLSETLREAVKIIEQLRAK